MTRSSHYTPESPEVATILDGVWKSGVKTYYRIAADGKHIDVRIREELIAALGISSRIATGLLQQANLPCAPYVCTRTTEKAQKAPSDIITMTVKPVDDDIELDEPDDDAEAEFPQVEIETSPSSKKSKKLTIEERDEKAARLEEAANSKRYQYIETSSGKHGIWDDRDAYVVFLAYTREEAIEEMVRLKSGKSCTVIYAGGSGTTRPGITY
jgi:hypothetical protein